MAEGQTFEQLMADIKKKLDDDVILINLALEDLGIKSTNSFWVCENIFLMNFSKKDVTKAEAAVTALGLDVTIKAYPTRLSFIF